MHEEVRIVKLSGLLNSALRLSSGNKADKQKAYSNTIKLLESTMMRTVKKPVKTSNSDEKEREEESKRKSETVREKSSDICQERNDNKERSYGKETGRERDVTKRNESVESSKTGKKRMKWNDYLQLQVDKQRKINEELGIVLKKKIKEKKTEDENTRVVSFKKNIDIKELDKDLRRFKPVQIRDNFKKLDEQECFFEEDDAVTPNKKTQEEVQKPQELLEIPEDPNQNEELDNSEKASESLLKQSTDEDNKIKEILQRYEKTIGKIKPNTPSEQTALPDTRAKSAFSHYSTESQQNAYLKLKQLQDEEAKIKQKKEELLKFLESRSEVRGSSRPATVASLYPKRETPELLLRTPQKAPIQKSALPEIFPVQRQPLKSAQSKHSHPRRNSSNEIKDLINSLF